jgi:osmotically-inducible protein OsmY
MAQIHRTPTEIQQDVIRELKWDTRVSATEVGVEVDGRIVTLTGTVDSWAKKLAAQEAAHRVIGVLDVANDIQVKIAGGMRDDTDIAKAVRAALEWDAFVPAERIQSTVGHGVVTLAGKVVLARERADAERAVRNLLGVRQVVNKIEIEPPKLAPTVVKTSIEAALQRHASREAQRISVDVRDGEVTLRGAVTSWDERTAAINAAIGTPGVRSVVDQLSVEL